MQINRIEMCTNSNPIFTGKIVNNYALKMLKAGLSHTDADKFEKYVNDIEKINDGKLFIYSPTLSGNYKVGKIHRADKFGNPINPPMFYEKNGNSLHLFKQLHKWYKKVNA